jgi:integrase
MARVDFTAARVGRFECPEGKAQAFMWDAGSPGLGLRVTPKGTPAYIFQAAFAGKDLRITIGGLKAWSISAAREKARELQREIDQGKDPRQVKRSALAAHAEREAEKAAAVLKVEDAWPTYLKEGKPKRKDAWKARYLDDLKAMAVKGGEAKKRGKGETRPGPLYPLMAKPLRDINEDSLKEWFDAEAKAGKHQAARAFMMFRGFLRWCAQQKQYRHLVDVDAGKAPAILQDLPASKRRTDCLDGGEQVKAWFAGVAALENKTAAAYLQVLLLTGARKEEIAAIKWSDVDFRWRKLTIADKVDATREIPLGGHVGALMRSLPRRNDFVFASESKSGRIADARSSHERVLKHAGLVSLTLHGLRRSFATFGEAAGCPAGAIAQVMGHRPSGVHGGYTIRSVDQLREYLDKAESYILELAGVAPLTLEKEGAQRAVK